MEFEPSEDQRLLVDSWRGLLEKQSRPEDVRNAEPLGFDSALWQSVCDLGPIAMALGESDGGWSATMLDLCLVGEVLGQHCAAVPVIEGQVAARLLARLGRLDAEPDDGRVLTIALHAPIDGTARLVPAGAVAQQVLARREDAVVAVRHTAASPQVPNHANLPLADIATGGAEAVAAGPQAVAAFEIAIDEWLLLTASALVGLSAAALALATEYACTRTAFGVPIGSFQGVAHPLADVATGIDGARLLLHEAAWSFDIGHDEAAQRACMAFAFAVDVARMASYWGVHTLGGYGVMMEYDAQLYFRRARGWAGVFGDADSAYRRVARHRYRHREH